MAETDFDAIVVGSGCAGAVAAYELAKAGKSTLVVERGNFAGAKNMTGGRIYSHSLKKVFPDFESEAPLERKITHERIALMDPASQTAVDFTSPELAEEGKDSYSVLRAPFDQWLASKAEDAGAEYICGIAVEELLKDGSGRVVGGRAGEDEITAEVVVLAEGVNPLLSERCLGNPRPKPSQMAVGIKQVFELPAQTIEDRFLVPDGANETPVYQMLEDFKNHPAVAPIIRGAKLVEHSGHMVPEGGYGMIPKYVFDGCLVAGESAGLCMNMGYQVRGMDFAVASGQMAGQAAMRALDAGDTSEAGLASYKDMMEGSFVIQDLRTFSKWPHVMEGWDRMFAEYPVMARDVFNAMFSVDGKPQKPLMKRMMPIVKQRGLFKLAGEVRKAVKSL